VVESSHESLDDVSRPSAGDIVRAGIDTGLQLIPGGGLALPFLQLVVASPLQKRRDSWMQDLADRLTEMESRGQLSRADLESNEAFATAVYHGVRAAISTSASEKHDALRNAALNSALRLQPEADLFEMFLRYLNDFTPMHIKLLMLFDDPARHLETSGRKTEEPQSGNKWDLVAACLPELVSYKIATQRAWEELGDRGLVEKISLDGMATPRSLTDPMATHLGQRFVRFISDPPEPMDKDSALVE
jgi:hypothetical protein